MAATKHSGFGTTFKDISGRTFGRFTVLPLPPELNKYGTYMWWCQCECGNKCLVRGTWLRNGHSKSCGCLRRDDLTGRKIGRLMVVGRDESRSDPKNSWWHCRCECGNTKVISGGHLMSRLRPTRSCGCLRAKLIRHEGQQFGKLTVVEFAGFRDGHCHGARWRCRCECGKTVVVIGSNLRRGNTTTCGCGKLLDLNGEGNRRDLLRNYKKAAQENHREWSITDAEATSMFQSDCHYCGCAPSTRWSTSGPVPFLYNGIDRIDNGLGYTPANTVTCCRRCNFAKGTSHYADFIRWARRLGRHQLRRGKTNGRPGTCVGRPELEVQRISEEGRLPIDQ